MTAVSEHANLIEVLDDRVQSLFEAGQIDDAIRITQTALDSARRAANHDPVNLSALTAALELMADLRRAQGHFQDGESLYLEALETYDAATMPPEQQARLKSGLAALYDAHELPEKAVILYDEAIGLYGELGAGHEVSIANLYNNLAMLHKDLGNFEEAEGKYINAVKLFEKANGKDCGEAATVYNNLGGLYSISGYPDQAREMHKIALEIRQKIFDENDPEIAQSLCNLATAAHDLDESKLAMQTYEKALRIFERNLPRECENFAITASNYCTILREQGLHRKANSLERQVNKILKKFTRKG